MQHSTPNGHAPRPAAQTTSPAPTADGVFISPRIIDKGAFDQYSSQLRELLEQGARQGESLRAASAEADRLHKALRDAGSRQTEAVESAARLAKSLTDRVTSVESMLARATDLASMCQSFEQRAEQIVQAKVAALEQRFGQILEQFGRQAQERVQAAATLAAAAVEQARNERDAMKKQIETAAIPAADLLRQQCDRAQKMLTGTAGSLPAWCDQLSAAASKASQTASELQSVQRRADESVAKLSESLEGAVAFSDQLIKQNEAAHHDIGAALAACEQAREVVRQRAADAQSVVKPFLELEARAGEGAAKAERILARVDAARDSGRQMVAELAQTVDRMQGVLEALEPWRSLLLEDAADGPLPAQITNIVEQVRAGIVQDLAKMAAAMNLIASRAAAPAVPVPNPNARQPQIVVVRSNDPTLRLAEST